MAQSSVAPLYRLERLPVQPTEELRRSGIVDLRCGPDGRVFVATPEGVFAVDESTGRSDPLHILGLLPEGGCWEIRCFDFFPCGRLLVVMKKPNNDGILKVVNAARAIEREFHVRAETFMCCSDFSVDSDGDVLVTAQNKVLKIPRERLSNKAEDAAQPELEVVCVSDDSFTTCGCVSDRTFIYIADVNRVVKYSRAARTFNYVAGDGRFASADGFGCNAAFQEISWMSLSTDGTKLFCLEQGPVLRQVDLRTNEVLTVEFDDDAEVLRAFHDAECNMSHLWGTQLFLYRYSFTELLPVFHVDLSQNRTLSTFDQDMCAVPWRLKQPSSMVVMVQLRARDADGSCAAGASASSSVCAGREVAFWADRRVLCHRSTYFANFFGRLDSGGGAADGGDCLEPGSATCAAPGEPVDVHGVSRAALGALLAYLATDRLVADQKRPELLLELMRIADLHGLSRLSKMCERLLVASVCPGNVLDLLVETGDCPGGMRPLRRELFRYACDHWGDVVQEAEATVRGLVARGEPLMAELLLRCPTMRRKDAKDALL